MNRVSRLESRKKPPEKYHFSVRGGKEKGRMLQDATLAGERKPLLPTHQQPRKGPGRALPTQPTEVRRDITGLVKTITNTGAR
jgi:hypothetical protein